MVGVSEVLKRLVIVIGDGEHCAVLLAVNNAGLQGGVKFSCGHDGGDSAELLEPLNKSCGLGDTHLDAGQILGSDQRTDIVGEAAVVVVGPAHGLVASCVDIFEEHVAGLAVEDLGNECAHLHGCDDAHLDRAVLGGFEQLSAVAERGGGVHIDLYLALGALCDRCGKVVCRGSPRVGVRGHEADLDGVLGCGCRRCCNTAVRVGCGGGGAGVGAAAAGGEAADAHDNCKDKRKDSCCFFHLFLLFLF